MVTVDGGLGGLIPARRRRDEPAGGTCWYAGMLRNRYMDSRGVREPERQNSKGAAEGDRIVGWGI
jgi:hypothetical protein